MAYGTCRAWGLPDGMNGQEYGSGDSTECEGFRPARAVVSVKDWAFGSQGNKQDGKESMCHQTKQKGEMRGFRN